MIEERVDTQTPLSSQKFGNLEDDDDGIELVNQELRRLEQQDLNLKQLIVSELFGKKRKNKK